MVNEVWKKIIYVQPTSISRRKEKSGLTIEFWRIRPSVCKMEAKAENKINVGSFILTNRPNAKSQCKNH